MALNKREYVDNETVITARNLNEIQDEIIANRQDIEELQKQGASAAIINASVE